MSKKSAILLSVGLLLALNGLLLQQILVVNDSLKGFFTGLGLGILIAAVLNIRKERFVKKK
ncbi:hypothetical protein ACG2LH_10385 [Zhouia sp. PK063]|uniref:hypothetical protein n=1 Tax=Zhouia sp. PK063 TaxID=3373602 RepID=UPI0037AE03D6